MKSGTNQFHGSAYDYLANEAFNAATPWPAPFQNVVYGFGLAVPLPVKEDERPVAAIVDFGQHHRLGNFARLDIRAVIK